MKTNAYMYIFIIIFVFSYISFIILVLYVYTIELNSKFFTAAFVETTNIISFLQTAECNILDVKLTECPIL